MQSIAALSLIPPTSLADDQQRQKRTHPKVRTGCTTCKARRIKCDGVKPVCSRCRLSNRKCVYAVPKTWIFEPQKETPVLLKGPPPITLGDHDERRAFDFFKQATVPHFTGQHDLQPTTQSSSKHLVAESLASILANHLSPPSYAY